MILSLPGALFIYRKKVNILYTPNTSEQVFYFKILNEKNEKNCNIIRIYWSFHRNDLNYSHL